MSSRAPLQGVTVVVTRPAAQAEGLARRIEQAGGRALRFPVIEIDHFDTPELRRQAREALEASRWAIFVSANAVEGAWRLIGPDLPRGVALAAVGRATARALEARWGGPVLLPEREYNSEGLLATAPMQAVAGERITIFRGQGGRELLARELTARGAEVAYVECYRRGRPGGSIEPLTRSAVDLVCVTSNEGLQNLYEMAGPAHRRWLLERRLVVVGPRTARLARELGFLLPPLQAARADDEALVTAMTGFYNEERGHAGG